MKTQKKLLALLLVLCMFFSMSGNIFAADTDVVDVPDETFKAYLNRRLDPNREADADITKGDMKTITNIELPSNINNLEGIQYCTELTWFRANGVGTPKNLQLLGNCTKLTYLAVMSSYLDDISFVANLTELTQLNFFNDEISDISAINNLNKLTVLDLMRNHIVDLSPLSELYPQMTHIYGLDETATLTLECNREESGYCVIDNPVIGVDANPVAPNSLTNCEYDATTNTFRVPTGTESFSFKTTQPTVAKSGDFQNNFTTSVTVNINHTPQTGDLTITKSFAGLEEDEIPVEDIYFTLTMDGEEVEDAIYLEEFDCENGVYSLTIPASVGTYTIEEHEAEVDNYDLTCEIPDSFELTEAGYTLELENVYSKKLGNLTITKSFAGLKPSDELIKAINFTFTVDGEAVEDALYLEEFDCEDGVYSMTIPASVGTYTIEEHDAELGGYKHTCEIPDSFELTEAGYTLNLINAYAKRNPDTPKTVPTDLNGKDHIAYVIGFADGTVRPESNITRAETATMLYRLLTEERRDEIFTKNNAFSDVTADLWYNKAVSSMTNGGYIKGYEDGTFGGSKSITRAEFVTMLARFIGMDENASCSFVDAKPSHWAYHYIATATQAGWINGYADETFRPDQMITRAEAMAIINRVLNRGVDGKSNLVDVRYFTDNTDTSKWYYYEVIEATNQHNHTGIRPSENWTGLNTDYVYDIVKYEKPW